MMNGLVLYLDLFYGDGVMLHNKEMLEQFYIFLFIEQRGVETNRYHGIQLACQHIT